MQKLKSMRTKTGAAALAMALMVSASARADVYDFGFTESDANGQTYSGGFKLDSNPVSSYSWDTGFQTIFAISDLTGIYALNPGESYRFGPFDGNVAVAQNIGSGPQFWAPVMTQVTDALTGNLGSRIAVFQVTNPAFFSSSGKFVPGTYTIDGSSVAGQNITRYFDSSNNVVETGAEFAPLSASFTIAYSGPSAPSAPSAPAPLVGGGLLSALAALAALAMTRLLGRKSALA